MASENLFKRVACFTDLHFGLKHNSRTHNDDCEEFIKWFVSEAKKRDCDTCIFLGDFHHHRASINVSTLNYSISNMEYLSNNFENVYMIAGNHDLFYREKREITSLVAGDKLNNVHIIDEPLIKGDVAIIPWLVEDEWKKVKSIKTKYMFGHFEIPGFKMNALVSMPDHGEIQRGHFKNQDYVFSGHFHCRQAQDNIHYIGNPFGHNYGDAWDNERGAMFLEWGEPPEYVNWEDGPKYITCNLSSVLEDPDAYLKPNTHAKISLDVNITYEEANFIKDTFIENYNLRELKLIHTRSAEDEHEFEGEITFQTVDQIVVEQVTQIESTSFDTKKLLDIYNGL